MISQKTIIEMAKLNRIKPWQQEKHYILSAVLATLGEQSLVFKGGTYLWLFHGLPRFSEDLDFTEIEKLPTDLPERTEKRMDLAGFPTTIKKITDDTRTLTFRASVKGPLYQSTPSLCHVYVEISRREKILEKPIPLELSTHAYLLPATIINGMSLNEVVAEKVRATMTRNRARDLFDLYYLITEKKIAFNPKIINKKLEYYKMEFNPKTFAEKLEEKKQAWTAELNQLMRPPVPPFHKYQKTIQEWTQT